MLKKELRAWGIILVKTGIVTLLIALSFTFCDFIGLPVWASMLGLLPAAYVLCKWSGTPVPSVRKWGPPFVALGFWVWLMGWVLPLLEDGFYKDVVTVFFLAVAAASLKLIPEWPAKRSPKR